MFVNHHSLDGVKAVGMNERQETGHNSIMLLELSIP